MESPRAVRVGIGFILLTYLIIGVLYAVNTPVWQAPDEPAHYNYIRGLAETGRLPVLRRGDYDQVYLSQLTARGFPAGMAVDVLRYEGHQPPLYYLLATPLFMLSGGSLLALRLFSLVLGGAALFFAGLCAQALFPRHPALALGTAGFFAFLPQHVAMMAAVNNDALAELLMALGLWLLLRRSASRALGLVIGLAFLTKTTVYVLAPLAVFARLLLCSRRRRWNWYELWQMMLPALLLGAFWWGRNLLVYSWPDVLGLQRHAQIVVGQPRSAEWLQHYGVYEFGSRFAQTTFQSFWGQFGWMGVLMGVRAYRLLAAFSLLILAGLAIAFGQRPHFSARKREDVALLTATAVAVLVQYLGYNLEFVQHQGRYLFPALAPIALACAAGMWGWAAALGNLWPAGKQALRWLPAALAPTLAALALYALFGVVMPAFALAGVL